MLIVGNIYRPDMELADFLLERLDDVNRRIAENVRAVGGPLADIYSAFRGCVREYSVQQIEPNLRGATAIADAFRRTLRSEG